MIRVPRPKLKLTVVRRGFDEVLGVENAASSRGSTYWKQLRRCPREHALHQLGLRGGQPSEALTVGALFHLGLETYYRVIQAHQDALDHAQRDDHYFWGAAGKAEAAAFEALSALEAEPGYEDTYPEVERLLVAYFTRYRHQDRWRVLAVEDTLEVDDAAFAYSARLDLIVEDEADKRTKIVEHKTARAITADLVQNYQMDLQILGQVWLWNELIDPAPYYPFGGVVIDVTTKRKRPGPEFERLVVNPSRYHLDAFVEAQTSWEVLRDAYAQVGYPKALGNCVGASRYFSTCTYYDLCHGRPEFSVADWQREISESGAPYGYVLSSAVEEHEGAGDGA
jgi:hypothetical protein